MSTYSAVNGKFRCGSKKSKSLKYPKPTQQLYRPPSARTESGFAESTDSQHSSNASIHSSYSSDSRFYASSTGNMASNPFPIKGVLKRSRSFGNNAKSSSGGSGDEYGSSSLIDEGTHGRFLLTLDGLTWENLTLIKQALDREACLSLDATSLLKIVRILCSKVLEKPSNAAQIASLAMDIHQKQQQQSPQKSGKSSPADRRSVFLESLCSCLKEWFNEREKLRFAQGGARRWTGYILFLTEMYLRLKALEPKVAQAFNYSKLEDEDEDEEGETSDDSEGDDEAAPCEPDSCSAVDTTSADEEVSRAFSSLDGLTTSDTEESSSRSESVHLKKPHLSSRAMAAKVGATVLAKHSKSLATLLLDTFHAILLNTNSTPTEIECMQAAFQKCGRYLEEDNPPRLTALVFSIRDTLLASGTVGHQFIAGKDFSTNSSITKGLLEIIELAASSWKFAQSQEIYYFPYTTLD